jgi:hypothetical protein
MLLFKPMAMSIPSPTPKQTRKKFTKKVVKTRKSEITSIRDSLKKISEEESKRLKQFWDDHVKLFECDDEDDDDDFGKPIPIPVPITFFEPSSKDRMSP